MSTVNTTKPHKKRKKLVIVGNGGCGKTSLLTVFSKGQFPEEYIPTVFENDVKDIIIDNETIELAVWDTAGQEHYARLRPLSYRAADVVLIAFALNDRESLSSVVNIWLPEVHEYCPRVPIILVGTKSDLREDYNMKCIESIDGQIMCQKIDAKAFVETSAKASINVNELFTLATKFALQYKPAKQSEGCCAIS